MYFRLHAERRDSATPSLHTHLFEGVRALFAMPRRAITAYHGLCHMLMMLRLRRSPII